MLISKYYSCFRVLTFEAGALLFTGCCVFALYALVLSEPTSANIKFERFTIKSIGQNVKEPTDYLKKVFDRIGYKLDAVRSHRQVPRVFLANVPKDLAKLREPAERKNVFIMMTLPLVLNVNEIIQQDRAHLKRILVKKISGRPLTVIDKNFLKNLSKTYELKHPNIRELLKRVDIIPPSLALAQSAEESGWGTSRFASEGNALFGQRTWRTADGLVPKQREEGKKFRVRAFSHLLDGVKAYALNLNTNPFYNTFREKRAAMRKSNKGKIDGMQLAETLFRYSERGLDYIVTIQKIIRINNFTNFDEAQLSNNTKNQPLSVRNVDGRPDA